MACTVPPLIQTAAEIVVISPEESLLNTFSRVLDNPKLVVRWFTNTAEAVAFVAYRPTAIIIWDTDLTDGCWADVFDSATTSESTVPPILIVCSRLTDERLWAEVLNLGGYDLLIKPVEIEEARRVCFGALLASTYRRAATSKNDRSAERTHSDIVTAASRYL